MYYVQTVAPSEEPLSLSDAKAFSYIDISDDDALINVMIATSREYAENLTNRQFEVATFELFNERIIQDWQLPKNPIKSISKIEYMDSDGDYQTLSSDDYYLYGDNDIFRIHFDTIPSYKDHKESIKITFVSGYDVVPKSIVSWLKLKVNSLYENREQFVIGVSATELPPSHIDNILNMYKVQSV